MNSQTNTVGERELARSAREREHEIRCDAKGNQFDADMLGLLAGAVERLSGPERDGAIDVAIANFVRMPVDAAFTAAQVADILSEIADEYTAPQVPATARSGPNFQASPSAEPVSEAGKDCAWTQDEDGVYHTGCGNAFYFDTGSAGENKAKFCQYCGGTTKAIDYTDPGIEPQEPLNIGRDMSGATEDCSE